MSLIALLEASKDVAMAAREARAARAAEEVAEFEEFGADLAVAFDAEELAASEEALRLGQEFDDREEEAVSEREREDFEFARKVLAAEESSADEACSKDEEFARQMEEQERKEAARVAALVQRERRLADSDMCKGDLALAEKLAADIDAEETRLRTLERQDRRLANKLVNDENKSLSNMPQTEEKVRTLAKSINGDGPVSMRTRLRAKLTSMRRGVSDMTNKIEVAAVTHA